MVNIQAYIGILSGIIFAISASWYALDVFKGKVTASVATFFMFSVINASQLAALFNEKVWNVMPFIAVGLLSSVLICIFALRNKKIYFETPDKIGLAGALIGFILWRLTDNAALNIYVLSAVDAIIFIPLIIKSFKRPDLETTIPWRLNLLASTLLMLTITSASPVVWIVPLRQFTCSLLLNIGLYRGSRLASK